MAAGFRDHWWRLSTKRNTFEKRPIPMPKRKSPTPKSSLSSRPERSKSKDRSSDAPAPEGMSRYFSFASIRETVESVVVAFVLAFLFRTFEAEAFVIPTGSMATTLMGRHKDLTCPACGNPYQVGASEQVDRQTGATDNSPVEGGTCSMCRFPVDMSSMNPQEKSYPLYKGDRILVDKFCYHYGDPERWDVAVFRYPGGAKTNYIKRLVGLPNETLKISHGDLLVRPHSDGPESNDWTIARKPPKKLLTMLQPVFDNDVTPRLTEYGWPTRWNPVTPSNSDPGDGESNGVWETSDDLTSFATDGTADGDVWIRYEHRVPSILNWDHHLRNGTPPPGTIRPQLISDFCAYNSRCARARVDNTRYKKENFGLYWVGDLALRCTLDVKSPQGQVVLELVEGGRAMQCRIELVTGAAELSIDGLDDFAPAGKTAVRGPGEYEVTFANVDDQLRLWVDGVLIQFGDTDAATCYPPLDNNVPKHTQRASDLTPVGIGSEGAALEVRRLKIFRDIYYIAIRKGQSGTNSTIFPEALSDPQHWHVFANLPEVEFSLGEDQFLALGDNSARSSDSRHWKGFEYFVSRELLIGKALFIYWPHTWHRIPYVNIPFPFFPNFSQMGFVR